MTIGSALFIDHGTGISIGEGVVIGEDVSMLQEVTLGSSPEGEAGAPRIGRGVLLSAGATVLSTADGRRLCQDRRRLAGSCVRCRQGTPQLCAGNACWSACISTRPALNMDQSLP